jgi:Lrp/AsnC family transcriptional regulator for asnA, asnC and gidA
MTELDEINKDILRLLCEDSRYQYSQIQKKLKKKGHPLSREAVEYRVKRMIENGTIRKFAMITEPSKIGYQICVYFAINLKDPKGRDEIGGWLSSLPNTAYVHSATNLFDISARVFFTDTGDLLGFLERLENNSLIKDFEFDIIRKTYKVGPIAPV